MVCLYAFWFHNTELSSVVWSSVSGAYFQDDGFIAFPLTHIFLFSLLKIVLYPVAQDPLLHVSVGQAGKHFSGCLGKTNKTHILEAFRP